MGSETFNGASSPYDIPIEKLKEMMSSSVMKDFSFACEVLSNKSEPEAYSIMKSYVNDKDKYRRLYILKTIFRHPEALELVDFLENAIMSDDLLFVENGLIVISDYNIKVSEPLLLSSVCKHLPKLYTTIFALKTLSISDYNYAKLVEIFKLTNQCVQKEVISEILIEKYLPSKSKELFDLFGCDGFAKIRLLALKLAEQYGYNSLKFLTDIDGHVKKRAIKSLGELSFLTKYISKYHTDVSDDLKSAIIYNPNGNEHLYVEYNSEDDFSPYTLSFSFQHVHETDQESASEWIDGILKEKILSIEYFNGEDRCFGGQINACDLANLSYELLEQEAEYYGITKLLDIADNFKVRGWTGKNDFDGLFTKNDDVVHIEIVSKA